MPIKSYNNIVLELILKQPLTEYNYKQWFFREKTKSPNIYSFMSNYNLLLKQEIRFMLLGPIMSVLSYFRDFNV